MENQILERPAHELTADELKAILKQKQEQEAAEREQSRRSYEHLRDETVQNIVCTALQLNAQLKEFKTSAYSHVNTMYELLQEHSNRHAKGKGNVTLDTTDGKYRVAFKRADFTRFDERSTQAESHILEFLSSELPADSKTTKLVRLLLERKKGEMDKNNVLKLISMKNDFENEHWRSGITLLQESIVPDYTKFYMDFYVRTEDGEWQQVGLHFSRL